MLGYYDTIKTCCLTTIPTIFDEYVLKGNHSVSRVDRKDCRKCLSRGFLHIVWPEVCVWLRLLFPSSQSALLSALPVCNEQLDDSRRWRCRRSTYGQLEVHKWANTLPPQSAEGRLDFRPRAFVNRKKKTSCADVYGSCLLSFIRAIFSCW